MSPNTSSAAALFLLLVFPVGLLSQSFRRVDVKLARRHALPPRRTTIPGPGAQLGREQIRVTLTVSPEGDVTAAKPDPTSTPAAFWPRVKDEVLRWRFRPFEIHGQPTAALVDEEINLRPPEQLPQEHLQPPGLRNGSSVSITLKRYACLGNCPVYAVTLHTNRGILFEGKLNVIVCGPKTAPIEPEKVRALARRFIHCDFYSMKNGYEIAATDLPGTNCP